MLLFKCFCAILIFYAGFISADHYDVVSFELDDSLISAYFEGYESATFTLSSSGTVDFWITDEDGYNDWKDDKTPATARMYKDTYCNDCNSFETTFTLPSSTLRYYFIVSAIFPSHEASGTLTLNYIGSGSYSDPKVEDDDTPSCFSAEAKVLHRNGSVISLDSISIGDDILALSHTGEYLYSPVVHVPHKRNDAHSALWRLVTPETYSDVTRDHLLMSCVSSGSSCSECLDFSWGHIFFSPIGLRRAEDLFPGTCLLLPPSDLSSKIGRWVPVIGSGPTPSPRSEGLYSVVTEAPYPVVNGIVSSPFGTSHALPNALYSVHRIAHWFGINEQPSVRAALELMNSEAERVISLPILQALYKPFFTTASSIFTSKILDL